MLHGAGMLDPPRRFDQHPFNYPVVVIFNGPNQTDHER
jgi:hypothetical protein